MTSFPVTSFPATSFPATSFPRGILKPSAPLSDVSQNSAPSCYPLVRKEHISPEETEKEREELEEYMDQLIESLFTSEFLDMDLQHVKRYHEPPAKRSLVWKEGLILSEHDAWTKQEYDRRSVPDYVRMPCSEYELDDYVDEYAGIAVGPYATYRSTEDVLQNPPPIVIFPRRNQSMVFSSMSMQYPL